ncbi:MAG: MFS transporter [Chloroflexota bacterium]|nr:MFS transporter [Chloroflexota bacterium]
MPHTIEGAAPPRQWSLLSVLMIGGFTTALNVTMLSPLLTRIAAEFSISEAKAGQLATVTTLSSGVMALIAAPWMDRYSRGAWIRFECVLLLLGSLLSAFAPSFGVLLGARVIAGIGGAIIGANCLAAVGDLYTNPHARNRALGLVGTSFTLGAVVGLPLLTLIAEAASWRWAIGLLVPLTLIVMVGSFQLPRSAHAPGGPLWRGWAKGYARVLRNAETVWLLVAMGALMVVWFGWLIYFGAYAERVFAVSAGMLSLLFLVGGGSEIVANNVAPLILRWYSARRLGALAAAVTMLNLLVVGVVYTQDWALFPFIAIASAAGSFIFLCINILLLDSLPSSRGAVMSLQSGSLEIGGAVGVAFAGGALAYFDDYEMVYRLLGLLAPLLVIAMVLSLRRGPATGAVASVAPSGAKR